MCLYDFEDRKKSGLFGLVGCEASISSWISILIFLTSTPNKRTSRHSDETCLRRCDLTTFATAFDYISRFGAGLRIQDVDANDS